MACRAAIGVIDSGVGGLSVLAELQAAMPHEDFVYLGDTAHVPYGPRDANEIVELTERAVAMLCQQGVKAIVVACNTAAAFSLKPLRARYHLPIFGLVPAVKPAVERTKTGVVAVLATPGTLKGPLLHDVIQEFADPAGVKVIKAVNAELVPLVEAGQADSACARHVLRETLTPLLKHHVDQLVLGCTHYPFLLPSIQAEFNDRFALVDSGAAVARHTRNILTREQLLNKQQKQGTVRFLLTGPVQETKSVIMALLTKNMHNKKQSSDLALPIRIERIQT